MSSRTGLTAAFAALAVLGTVALAQAEITQRGALRLAVSGKLSPRKLPREKAAPVAVAVGWSLATTDGGAVPKLSRLRIEINRHGHFDSTGLPTCPYERIRTASSSRAMQTCRSALVGRGSFNAEVALRGQEPYATQGRLLVFNGISQGKPVLFGQIYSAHPFATSFVVVFNIGKLGDGAYGTVLSARLPRSLTNWGNLTGLEMTLSRRYTYRGRPHSYLSAGCPAPKGFSVALFPLARASFRFSGGEGMSSVLGGSCRVMFS
jgi:hypothetical protein